MDFGKNYQTARPFDAEIPERVSCFRAPVFVLPNQEIFPPDVEIFSLAET
jgi:hypothetical protein